MKPEVPFTECEGFPKPWHHKLITDVIIFVPVLGVFAYLVDLAVNPPQGLVSWLSHILFSLCFVYFWAKLRTLGISLGFHRLGTHPSYETHWWIKAFFFADGCMSGQGRMVNWLSDHHHHHIHSDEDGDLHSPRHGKWHAYIGWLRGLLFNRKRYPIFENDKIVMFFSRTFFFWLAIGLILPAYSGQLTGFGAWRGFLCGGLIAMFVANNVTYWVNCGCHWKGKRNFELKDDSTNFYLEGFWGRLISIVLADLSWGETNHNNHHARAISANHGMFKDEIDGSAALLRFLERCKLVWNVKWTTEEQAYEMKILSRMSAEEKKVYMLSRKKRDEETLVK